MAFAMGYFLSPLRGWDGTGGQGIRGVAGSSAPGVGRRDLYPAGIDDGSEEDDGTEWA
jgi:hypothetical protein